MMHVPTSQLAIASLGFGWLRIAFAGSLAATIATTVAVASGLARRPDAWLLATLRDRLPLRPDGSPGKATTAIRDLTALGGDMLRILFLVFSVVALGCDGRGRVAGALTGIFVIARLALVLTKAVVRRSRPPVPGETLTTYTSSFPSGHTFMSGVLYLTAAMLIPTGPATALLQTAIATALLLSLAIGVTRVSFGIHWPSDVAAGWLASIAWSTGCVLLLVRSGMLG